MRTIVVAFATAIFFAAVIVELTDRLWPGSQVALLIVATIAPRRPASRASRNDRPTRKHVRSPERPAARQDRANRAR